MMAKRTALLGMLICCLTGATALGQAIAPTNQGDIGLFTMPTADNPRAGQFTLRRLRVARPAGRGPVLRRRSGQHSRLPADLRRGHARPGPDALVVGVRRVRRRRPQEPRRLAARRHQRDRVARPLRGHRGPQDPRRNQGQLHLRSRSRAFASACGWPATSRSAATRPSRSTRSARTPISSTRAARTGNGAA